MSVLALIVVAIGALAARCWNARDVFVEKQVYFVDADCYSRMTRAWEVAAGHGLFIRHHAFENWPQGVEPHTTAPMDWTIVALQKVLDGALAVLDRKGASVLQGQTLDLAGALISPLIGVFACVWLAWWARRFAPDRMLSWLGVGVLFAASPILVHGTLLGRPDHQSLLVLLVAVALSAEVLLPKLALEEVRRWSIVAGVTWALACWVSLYEPLMLLVAVAIFSLAGFRQRLIGREFRASWIVFAVLLALALALDGWRVRWPDAALRDTFARWQQTIGELGHLDPRTALLYRWIGALILPAPVLLALAAPKDRRAWLLLALLLLTLALTIWQLRWGYFLALIFAMSLPWQFRAMRRWWIAWPAFVLAAWPMAQDWDEKLFPEDHPEQELEKKRGVLRLEQARLREVALAMRSSERRPFIAPWWLSPALAYWSGQPGVAGSSHESLPGIVVTAKFFLAADAETAERIALERGVKWIVTDDPDRLVRTSETLLGVTNSPPSYAATLHDKGEPRERVDEADLRAASPAIRARLLRMADEAEAGQLGSAAFSCVSSNQFYKLFSVKEAKLQP